MPNTVLKCRSCGASVERGSTHTCRDRTITAPVSSPAGFDFIEVAVDAIDSVTGVASDVLEVAVDIVGSIISD